MPSTIVEKIETISGSGVAKNHSGSQQAQASSSLASRRSSPPSHPPRTEGLAQYSKSTGPETGEPPPLMAEQPMAPSSDDPTESNVISATGPDDINSGMEGSKFSESPCGPAPDFPELRQSIWRPVAGVDWEPRPRKGKP
jgi:hypothetical protein